ncbi:hypothetical protein BDV96DRAFT_582896 [Lophiotrema nucula]|uniref:Uncharacterized protein n=1 Tax=Lophiotrema nucula TaxID=690887 RepID=A0A6A5YUD4_9PLEO|nr:hypothetical protein BDV96DRAFT_582896 [Lophiotrema nucula]
MERILRWKIETAGPRDASRNVRPHQRADAPGNDGDDKAYASILEDDDSDGSSAFDRAEPNSQKANERRMLIRQQVENPDGIRRSRRQRAQASRLTIEVDDTDDVSDFEHESSTSDYSDST